VEERYLPLTSFLALVHPTLGNNTLVEVERNASRADATGSELSFVQAHPLNSTFLENLYINNTLMQIDAQALVNKQTKKNTSPIPSLGRIICYLVQLLIN